MTNSNRRGRIRLAWSAAAVTGLLVLSGCGDFQVFESGVSESGGGVAASDELPRPASCDDENPFIAVSLPNLTNPYYVAMKQGFEQEGERLGYDVQVQVAGDDDAEQLAQVQAMLQRQPCALALNPVKSEPAVAIVSAANEAEVPVFTVNVIVDEDTLNRQGATIAQYLGADNFSGGEDVGKQVIADFGTTEPIQVGLITEPDEVPVVERDKGFEKALRANPNAEVVAEVDGNVTPTDSLQATSELLQGNPDVDVLFASTGPAAFGALQAVRSSGRDVKVYGFCAAEEPLTPDYPACAAQEPEDYGARVMGQIDRWRSGKPIQPEILRPLKMFETGQTPPPGEVG